jgi:hypothetical protein
MSTLRLATLLTLALTLAASANPVPLFDGKTFTGLNRKALPGRRR